MIEPILNVNTMEDQGILRKVVLKSLGTQNGGLKGRRKATRQKLCWPKLTVTLTVKRKKEEGLKLGFP